MNIRLLVLSPIKAAGEAVQSTAISTVIMVPNRIVDYVGEHVLPDYAERKEWLKENASVLDV